MADDPKMDAFKALVEQCESRGMRDDPVVMAARAALPKPPEEPKPTEPHKTP